MTWHNIYHNNNNLQYMYILSHFGFSPKALQFLIHKLIRLSEDIVHESVLTLKNYKEQAKNPGFQKA